MSELEQAKAYHQKAMEIYTNTLYKSKPYRRCNILGLMYEVMGELEQAKDCHQKAIYINLYKRIRPKPYRRCCIIQQLRFGSQGYCELEWAKDCHQRAIQIRKNELGPNHIDVATSYNNLGSIY